MPIIQIGGNGIMNVSRGAALSVQSGINYDELVLQSNPLGYWKLDESSGTSYADSSANSTPGTLIGSEFRQTDPIVQGSTNALYLNNSTRTNDHVADTYVRLLNNVSGGHPFTNLGNNNNFTLEAWVQFKTEEHNPGPSNWRGHATIVELRRRVGSGSYRIPFNFGMENGFLHYGREFASASASNQATDTTLINDGAIHHVVCVIQDDQVDFYVDGVFSSTVNITGDGTNDVSVQSNPCDMNIGIRTRDNGVRDETGWCGMVSNVAVYGTALSPTTILAHYNAGTGLAAVKRTTYPTVISSLSPIAYYRLDEALPSTTAIDSGSNALNGTYTTFSNGERQMMPVIFEPDTTSVWFSSNDDVEILNSVAGGHPYTAFGDNDYTIEAWLWPNGTATGSGGSWWTSRCIIELRQQTASNGTVTFHFGIQSSNRLGLGMADNQTTSQDKVLSNNSVLTSGQRHHVAVTHSISGTPGSFVRNVEFFVDGVSQGTGSLSIPNTVVVGSTTCNMTIGARAQNNGNHTDRLRGFMHELAIHNSVLSGATLLAHYNAGVV